MRYLLLMAMSVGGLLAIGCGEDGQTSTDESDPLSHTLLPVEGYDAIFATGAYVWKIHLDNPPENGWVDVVLIRADGQRFSLNGGSGIDKLNVVRVALTDDKLRLGLGGRTGGGIDSPADWPAELKLGSIINANRVGEGGDMPTYENCLILGAKSSISLTTPISPKSREAAEWMLGIAISDQRTSWPSVSRIDWSEDVVEPAPTD